MEPLPPSHPATSSDARVAVLTATRFLTRGVARIAYSPPEGAGPNVVLLHRLLSDRRMFSSALQGGGMSGLAIDLRGHGASAAVADRNFTLDDLALDVSAVLSAESWDQAVLAGTGLGGLVALCLAKSCPDLVTGLVLLDVLPWSVATDELSGAERTDLEALRRQEESAARQAYGGQTRESVDTYMTAHFGTDWRSMLDPVQVGSAMRSAPALVRLLPAAANLELSEKDLSTIGCNVVLITTQQTRPAQLGMNRRLTELMPSVTEFEAIPGQELTALVQNGGLLGGRTTIR